MRTKKLFSFDEERDAEEILRTGFPDGDINYTDMYLVAKYFKKTLKYGAIRLEKELIRFCKEQDRNFNPVVEAEYIRKWVNSAMSYDLRKIDAISISQKEIDVLKQVELPNERKLLFIAFVLAKALKKRNTRKKRKNLKVSDSFYIHYSNFSDIIKLSKVKNISEAKLASVFHKYSNLFTFYNPERELIRLDFADPHPSDGIEISDLDNVLEHYNVFLGSNKPLGICTECGKSFVKNNNKQKRCKDCSVKARREKTREYVRKYRKEEKNT